jgi:hypothetical protein
MSFQHPFHFRFPACAQSVCALSVFLFIFLYCCLPLIVFVVFVCFSLYCFISLFCLHVIRLSPLSFELCCLRVLNFGPNFWVVDAIVILAFGSRRKSFGMGVFLLSGSRNNNYPCIWLSLFGIDLVLNLKFSHGLADWSWLWIVFVIFYTGNLVVLCYDC